MKDRIKECRLKCGYTQKYVALSVGVSFPSVSQWESGTNTPTIENFVQLADLFGTTVDYLVGRDDTPPNPPQQQYDRSEIRLIENFRSLSSQGKEYIRQQMAMAMQVYTGEQLPVPDVANQ